MHIYQKGRTVKFSNLSIRTQIGAGFAAIVAFVIALGTMALLQLATVGATTEQIATNDLPSVKMAARMSDLLGVIRRSEARHVMSTVDAEMDEQEARLAKARKDLADLEPRATQLFDAEAEVKALAEYKQHRDAWFAVWDQKLRAASRQGDAGLAEAKKLYGGESSKSFNAAFAAVHVGADLNLTHRADPILTRGWMPTV